MSARALVLFAHGARAASWATPFERLRVLVQSRTPDVLVSLAFLELMEPRLPQLVAQLADQGIEAITVVPVFLGQGGHVLRDLPLMVDELAVQFPALRIDVAGAVGEDAAVLDAMATYCIGTLAP
jgi:sirohydrochlorin cobaltochelatase